MFNIGFSELLIILLVAFLVVGPKDLPKVARALARFVRYLKAKWAEFLEETELDDTLKEFRSAGDEIKQAAREASPMEELKQAREETRSAFSDAKKTTESRPDTMDKEEEIL